MSRPFPQRIAIGTVSAVGNAVHLLPVVHSLRSHRPDVRITCIAQPGPAVLLRAHPVVDEVIVLDRARGARAFLDLRRELRARPFDLLINVQAYLKSGIVAALAPATVKLGYDRRRARDLTWLFSTERIPPRPRGHVQDEYLEFVEYLGVPARREWGLGPTAEERAHFAGIVDAAGRRTVALVLGTSRPEKEWPAERYAALVDALEGELGVRALLVGGGSARELHVADTIRRRSARRPLDLLARDLRRLVYVLDGADAVVSPDTGPMHAAVALGTPTVALMGFTNPLRFGPYRRFHDLMIDAYGDPGEVYAASAGHRPGRMERISVAEVVGRVGLALERYPRSPGSGHSGP